jgi:hypothetical protein
MKISMLVPVVLQVVMMAGPACANEQTDGLAESGCTLDELHSISLQQARHGTLKFSGCQTGGSVRGALSLISMSVHGAISDDLGIVSNGQYHKVSGARFIVSDIVNGDMEFNVSLNGSQIVYPNNMALFELSYM